MRMTQLQWQYSKQCYRVLLLLAASYVCARQGVVRARFFFVVYPPLLQKNSLYAKFGEGVL